MGAQSGEERRVAERLQAALEEKERMRQVRLCACCQSNKRSCPEERTRHVRRICGAAPPAPRERRGLGQGRLGAKASGS